MRERHAGRTPKEHSDVPSRVHNFAISLDGFGTGEGPDRDNYFGHAGERLHEWMFVTRSWDKDAGNFGVDNAYAQQHDPGIGAEIMGAGKWGFPGWHEDPEWQGGWGPNPPFHSPVFVLTHHTRPSIEMEGGTTYHFIDASPAEALEEKYAIESVSSPTGVVHLTLTLKKG